MRTIREAGAALRSRQVSCEELAKEAFAMEQRHRDLNAFITLNADEALAEAKALDRELAEGIDRGPLHGIPIAHKDLFFTKGIRTTNGSKVLSDFVPECDAVVVSNLRKAGAVSVGKLNMHEMAYGITSNNPHYGPVRNPHDRDRIPGGSSGGSGAAVVGRIVYAATGSDTGGSIRIPASYCGCVGFKPTFGVVSNESCFPAGESLDHMGPLTRTVDDAAIMLEAMSGNQFSIEPNLNVRVGLPENFYFDSIDPEVGHAVHRVKGASVNVPDPERLMSAARTILLVEASAWLDKIDRPDDLGSDVRTLFETGKKVPPEEYASALSDAALLKQEWAQLFETIDVLVTPTTPITAPRIGALTVILKGVEHDTRLLSTRFCRGINLLGYPAISIPCGISSLGLPIGLQIIGGLGKDSTVLNFAAALEANLPV